MGYQRARVDVYAMPLSELIVGKSVNDGDGPVSLTGVGGWWQFLVHASVPIFRADFLRLTRLDRFIQWWRKRKSDRKTKNTTKANERWMKVRALTTIYHLTYANRRPGHPRLPYCSPERIAGSDESQGQGGIITSRRVISTIFVQARVLFRLFRYERVA